MSSCNCRKFQNKVPISRKLREHAEAIVSHTLTRIGVSFGVQLRGEKEPISVRKSDVARYCKPLMEAYENHHPDILEHEKEVREKKAICKKLPSVTATKRPRLSEIGNKEDMSSLAKKRRTESEAPKAVNQVFARAASTRMTMVVEGEKDEEALQQRENFEEVVLMTDDQEKVVILDDEEEPENVEYFEDNVDRAEYVPTMASGDLPTINVNKIYEENLRKYKQKQEQFDDVEVQIIKSVKFSVPKAEPVNDYDDEIQILETPPKPEEVQIIEAPSKQADVQIIEGPPKQVEPPAKENNVAEMAEKREMSRKMRAQTNEWNYTIRELQKERQDMLKTCMQFISHANNIQQKIYELEDLRDRQAQLGKQMDRQLENSQ